MLVVIQATDTGGKDSTIRRVFGPLNPAGVRVTGFTKPSEDELAHDYLWRVHPPAPRTRDAVFLPGPMVVAPWPDIPWIRMCPDKHVNQYEK